MRVSTINIGRIFSILHLDFIALKETWEDISLIEYSTHSFGINASARRHQSGGRMLLVTASPLELIEIIIQRHVQAVAARISDIKRVAAYLPPYQSASQLQDSIGIFNTFISVQGTIHGVCNARSCVWYTKTTNVHETSLRGWATRYRLYSAGPTHLIFISSFTVFANRYVKHTSPYLQSWHEQSQSAKITTHCIRSFHSQHTNPGMKNTPAINLSLPMRL